VFAHIGNCPYGFFYLIPYVIGDPGRFRRVICVLLFLAAWRLFGDGSLQALLHDAATMNGRLSG
jgi:hypothetical protein